MEHLVLTERCSHPSGLVAVPVKGALDVVPTTVLLDLIEPVVLKNGPDAEHGEVSGALR